MLNTFKKVGEDRDNCREYYKDEKGQLFATVYNAENKKVLYTLTEEGEPLRPAFGTEEESIIK